MGQRQKVVGGRVCGGEVRKRETGEVGGMGDGAGKVSGVIVVVMADLVVVGWEEEPLVVVSVGSGLGFLFTRFRAGTSIMEELKFPSSEAFRFFDGSWSEEGDACSCWGVIVVDVSMVVVMVVVTVIVVVLSTGGESIASFFTTAGRNPGVPA